MSGFRPRRDRRERAALPPELPGGRAGRPRPRRKPPAAAGPSPLAELAPESTSSVAAVRAVRAASGDPSDSQQPGPSVLPTAATSVPPAESEWHAAKSAPADAALVYYPLTDAVRADRCKMVDGKWVCQITGAFSNACRVPPDVGRLV